MKIPIVITLFIYLFSISSRADVNIDQLNEIPVLILMNNKFAGSGFVCKNFKSELFLVTASHVPFFLKNKMWITKSDTLSIIMNRYPQIKDTISMDLKGCINLNNVSTHSYMDVCVIKLGLIDKLNLLHFEPYVYKECNNLRNTTVNQKDAFNKIKIGTDIFLFGYPTSLGIKQHQQVDPTAPLLRKGVIAGKNYSKKTFIVDCPVYPGNSGGPVVSYNSDKTFTLIGIAVEFIPYEEKWINIQNKLVNSELSNSGYSVVVPVNFIRELIN